MKEIRFYVVPKGTRFQTSEKHLNRWSPVGDNDTCLVFENVDEAEQALLDAVYSAGREEFRRKYAHRSKRCRHLVGEPGARAEHSVFQEPLAGTLCVCVAWLRPLVDKHPDTGKPGYVLSDPPSIPVVRITAYRRMPVIAPAGWGGPARLRFLTWGEIPPLSNETIAKGHALRCFALTDIG